MRRRMLLGALFWLTASGQAPEEPLIRISVDLVQVDAIVTGPDRRLVRDLSIDDFEFRQDGREQELRAVSLIDLASQPAAAAPQPKIRGGALSPGQVRRTITIVVDDLNLSQPSVHNVREGLHKFIGTELAQGNLICILRTSGGAGNFQSFTADRRQLGAIIDRLRWRPQGPDPDSEPPLSGIRDSSSFGIGPSLARIAQGTNELTSEVRALGSTAAIEWAFQGLSTMPGRKSLILVTEGILLKRLGPSGVTPTRAFPRFQRLISEAHRAGVVFHTIHPGGFGQQSFQSIGEEDALGYLPAQTGGLFLRGRNFLENDIRQIVEEQSGFYLLSYKPPEGTFDGKHHKIEVRVKRKGLTVRARRELFGEAPGADDVADGPRRQLLRALASPFNSGGIPLRLTALPMVDAAGAQVVRCLLHIDGKAVARQQDGEALRVQLDVAAAAVDGDGKLTAIVDNRIDAPFEPGQIARLERSGFVYGVAYRHVKPGPYQIRIAVRDAVSGELGSASEFLEIPDLSRKTIALSGVALDRKRDAASQTAEEDAESNPAVRRYHAGDQLAYAMQLYNAPPAKGRKLYSQIVLYRDARVVYTGRRDPLILDSATPARVAQVGGVFYLGKTMPPGLYEVELRVVDTSGRKETQVSRWTDFTIE